MGKTGSISYVKILNNKGGFRWVKKAYLVHKKAIPKTKYKNSKTRKMKRSIRSRKLN